MAACLTAFILNLLFNNDIFPHIIIRINAAYEHTKRTLTIEILVIMIYVRETGIHLDRTLDVA